MTSRHLFVALALALLAGCASRQPAPVSDRAAPPPAVVEAPAPVEPEKPAPKPIPTHTVKRGETLVAIALQYGLEYRELAAWNGITNVNVISVGQVLQLAPPMGMGQTTPLAVGPTPLATAGPPIEARPLANTDKLKVEPRGQKLPFSEKTLSQLSVPEAGGTTVASAPPAPISAPASPEAPARPPAPAPEPEKASPGTDSEDVDWMWPVKGKALAPFTDSTKGVDIPGKKGAPVQAAAAGRVIYAGELRGYGRLVIIKHNATWVSAYAHNEKLLVKEQQDVKKGQKIAEMGSSDTDQVKLHFEVRRNGKPVDPAKVLPAP
ncbi:Murein hydrolase activator NlpD [Usitatibacter rugosus]|uniref:Murein hydrolase activator NlpD n=1 Tax=Usitatibacter rugosus TaxID=2732067 RepID=A0A6M4GVT1_9PROT|nr:peptidoglycan DD-metalloendopeptidase family protein [Usitatibacter rugosus]QJR11401.1 Murein hydrolase activator NlpD [Usitatibacter rugosus]